MMMRQPPQSDISEQDLEHATAVAAELVQRFGDLYWPFFERLERELVQRRERSKKLEQFARRRPSR